MTFVNLTPHVIKLPYKTIEPQGIVARCEETTKVEGYIDGVEIVVRTYGNVYDLPNPNPDTIYIVSILVRLARPDRTDLASPGDLIRDDAGQIIGCKNLVMNAL
jgi:hypothetical protein